MKLGYYHFFALFLVFEVCPAWCQTQFDGTWDTVVVCETTPQGAKGFRWQFNSIVQNGVLVGKRNMPNGERYTLEGSIRPDGTSDLHATGISGDSDYNYKFTPKGTPIDYLVKVQLATGKGERQNQRICHFTFRKL
jgi:hypothetical protein